MASMIQNLRTPSQPFVVDVEIPHDAGSDAKVDALASHLRRQLDEAVVLDKGSQNAIASLIAAANDLANSRSGSATLGPEILKRINTVKQAIRATNSGTEAVSAAIIDTESAIGSRAPTTGGEDIAKHIAGIQRRIAQLAIQLLAAEPIMGQVNALQALVDGTVAKNIQTLGDSVATIRQSMADVNLPGVQQLSQQVAAFKTELDNTLAIMRSANQTVAGAPTVIDGIVRSINTIKDSTPGGQLGQIADDLQRIATQIGEGNTTTATLARAREALAVIRENVISEDVNIPNPAEQRAALLERVARARTFGALDGLREAVGVVDQAVGQTTIGEINLTARQRRDELIVLVKIPDNTGLSADDSKAIKDTAAEAQRRVAATVGGAWRKATNKIAPDIEKSSEAAAKLGVSTVVTRTSRMWQEAIDTANIKGTATPSFNAIAQKIYEAVIAKAQPTATAATLPSPVAVPVHCEFDVKHFHRKYTRDKWEKMTRARYNALVNHGDLNRFFISAEQKIDFIGQFIAGVPILNVDDSLVACAFLRLPYANGSPVSEGQVELALTAVGGGLAQVYKAAADLHHTNPAIPGPLDLIDDDEEQAEQLLLQLVNGLLANTMVKPVVETFARYMKWEPTDFTIRHIIAILINATLELDMWWNWMSEMDVAAAWILLRYIKCAVSLTVGHMDVFPMALQFVSLAVTESPEFMAPQFLPVPQNGTMQGFNDALDHCAFCVTLLAMSLVCSEDYPRMDLVEIGDLDQTLDEEGLKPTTTHAQIAQRIQLARTKDGQAVDWLTASINAVVSGCIVRLVTIGDTRTMPPPL